MKLHKNDSKSLICCLKLTPSDYLLLPRNCLGAIYMYKVMKIIYVKSKFKAVLLKLSADDQSDNSFL